MHLLQLLSIAHVCMRAAAHVDHVDELLQHKVFINAMLPAPAAGAAVPGRVQRNMQQLLVVGLAAAGFALCCAACRLDRRDKPLC
jgi:hypothetical protein